VFEHNSLYGNACMIRGILARFHRQPTLTPRAHALVAEIEERVFELSDEIYSRRVEPDGSIVEPRYKRGGR
jgi:hypothetical protein